MTDPEAAQNEPEPATEAAPPPQPPRPQGRGAQLSQLEADELYARQLAEQYDNVGRAYEARTAAGANQGRYRGDGRPREPRRDSDDEHEYSFIDDELPVIRDQLRQGFFETQTKVNGWISTLRKRIEDSFDESEDPHHGHGGPQGQQAQGRYRPGESANSRRSGDYDADPQVLGDDFAGMRLSADGSELPPPPPVSHVYCIAGRGDLLTTAAPLNRTSAYRHQSASPRPSSGRRVGFKDEPEEINMYERSPPVPPKDSSASTGPAPKASKWQPLSTVAPQPIGDNDPFSLGDSDDEKDNNNSSKDTATASKDAGSKDATDDSSERLKKAAAEAMSDNLVDDDKSKK